MTHARRIEPLSQVAACLLPLREKVAAGRMKGGRRSRQEYSLHANPAPRRGITLMEVLIAMFVAAVGLMGLAALIPVGGHNLREAQKATSANAVARAAYREIKARGWLKPECLYGPADDGTPPVMRFPVCIDPLFLQFPVNNDVRRWTAPVALDNDPIFCDGTNLQPYLVRASLRQFPNHSTLVGPITFPTAERFFRNEDDKIFNLPDDQTKRATALLDAANRVQSNGDYSWMATVVPVYVPPSGNPRTFKVSVAVFYKRNLLIPAANVGNRTDGPPTERFVYADFLSGGVGWGGGDVRLRLPTNPAANTPPDRSDFPQVRAGNWVMLVALKTDGTPIAEWFRVVAVSKRADGQSGPEWMSGSESPSESNEWFVDVVLDGPAWDPTTVPDMDRDDESDITGTRGPYMTVFAAVFENVVGVYTKTIEVDSWAMP